MFFQPTPHKKELQQFGMKQLSPTRQHHPNWNLFLCANLKKFSKILQHPRPNPPKWFTEGYSHNAKNLDPKIWESLVSPITPSEVQSALNGPPKAPGYDGVTNTILKLATQCDTSKPNTFLKHLTHISNLWLSSGKCPALCSIGRMKLIPKEGKKTQQFLGIKGHWHCSPSPQKLL